MGKRVWHGRWSIFTTQAVSYLSVILVVSATYSYSFLFVAKDHLENEVGRKLRDVARIAARNAPFERLDLIKVGDDRTRLVLRLKEKLESVRDATGVWSIFVIRPDGSSLLDLRPEVLIGTPDDQGRLDDDFAARLGAGAAVHTTSYRAADGKLFISAYVPIMDPGGELFAIVGVDSGTREIEVIEQMSAQLYAIAGLGAVLAFGLAMLLARRLSGPIRAMAETARRVGRGEYEARVPIPSPAELATLARSLNAMAQQVQSRDVGLKEMAATVAHEVRNPLNSIKLLISLLDEELTDREQSMHKPVVETLHYEIGKLDRFLSEFLVYSRPLALARDDVVPTELAGSAVAMSAAAAKEADVRVSLEAEAGLAPIRIDRQRMEQSLLNVLLNAIQASEPGGHVVMRVSRSGRDGGTDYVVEDSGPGVPPEAMDVLFEPFFTTKASGTGLGLSNAARAVRAHGGDVLVEDAPGGGARFVIRLPPGDGVGD